MLTLNVHQIHLELVLPTTRLAFKGNLQLGLILALPKNHGVIGLRALYDLCQICHVDSEGQSLCAPINCAGFRKDGEIHEGHVTGIH